MVEDLVLHRPRSLAPRASGAHPDTAQYIAWHIRTADGETAASFNPKVHTHVSLQDSAVVCPAYLAKTEEAAAVCPGHVFERISEMPVYIATNRWARRCASCLRLTMSLYEGRPGDFAAFFMLRSCINVLHSVALSHFILSPSHVCTCFECRFHERRPCQTATVWHGTVPCTPLTTVWRPHSWI